MYYIISILKNWINRKKRKYSQKATLDITFDLTKLFYYLVFVFNLNILKVIRFSAVDVKNKSVRKKKKSNTNCVD